MSIVALGGVPNVWSLKRLRTAILQVKSLKGAQVEVLNFDKSRGSFKTAYIRVSERLDPLNVVQQLRRLNSKTVKLTPFIPDYVPDIPLANNKIRAKAAELSAEKVLVAAHRELLDEMVYKYSGLMDLSERNDHKLLDEIAEVLFRRLKDIIDNNKDVRDNSFALTRSYRKAHPHFVDFQLILSTLHRLEDAAGAPRTQLLEHDLVVSGINLQEPNDNRVLHKIGAKYGDKIVKKVSAHIQSLETSQLSAQLPEEAARIRVREALKKIEPYLNMICKQVILNEFVEEKGGKRQTPCHKFRMYGEPFLPNREVLAPLMKKFSPTLVTRSQRVHNMLRFNVNLNQYENVMALDGTVVSGAKLVVRLSGVREYSASRSLLAKIHAAFSSANPADEDVEFTDTEEWINEDELYCL